MKLRRALSVAYSVAREAAKRLRSGKWRAVERAHLKRYPVCAACGGTKRLQVHHVKPLATHPELELEPTNLLTLCMGTDGEHHLQVGHRGNWRKSNPNAREDAALLLFNGADR